MIKLGRSSTRARPASTSNTSFRGQYPEQRAAAFAAFRAGNPPHVMQMFDAGTGDMFGLPRATVPVSEVFSAPACSSTRRSSSGRRAATTRGPTAR